MSNTGLGKSLYRLYDLYFEHGCHAVTDSRLVAEVTERAERTERTGKRGAGCVFFALPGERVDGQAYARQAVAAGAVAAVVTRLPQGVEAQERGRYFVVEDTLLALQELAQLHRRTLGLPIVALTGSNGKTTTKELIGCVLRTKYRVATTVGNLNNHIGVPLTLLSFTELDDIGVVEMGANHPGEIARLCDLAEPNVGLVTNVGSAHLEGFGGPQGVRAAKGELYDYLARTGGAVIYSSEDRVLAKMVEERGFQSELRRGYAVSGFGIRIEDTRLAGGYNVANIAAALAVGDYFGIQTAAGLRAAAGYRPENNRSQRTISSGTGNTLYRDAYNANPSSMRAALDYFLGLPAQAAGDGDRGGDKVLILGDMRELGEYAAAEHRAVVERLLPILRGEEREGGGEGGGTEVFFVGQEFGSAARAVLGIVEREDLPVRVFQTVEELKTFLQRDPIRDRCVLIKGSRGMMLETLYELL